MKKLTPLYTLILLNLVVSTQGSLHSDDLCEVDGCSCTEDRQEIYCKCPHKEVIRIGDPQHSAGVSSPPESIRKMIIEECHHVEIMSRVFNKLPYIRNITLNKAHSIVIHPRVFNSRQSKIGPSLPLENFMISNVRNLEVRRHSFEGIEIYGTFSLNNVLLKSVPSLSFSFDLVNEFEIIGSTLHRISMWGIKLPKCHEFRSTERSHYYSLSSHALYMSCQNFILLQNTFGSLHDASMNVSYRYAEIRKNTFETITGKPFINFRHHSDDGSFIFRENKFRVDSPLPEDALSMPEFGKPVDYYIDNNHFVCDCEKLAWLIYSTQDESDDEQRATVFLKELVNTSGKCLTCDLRGCSLGKEDFVAYLRKIQVSRTPDGYACSKENVQELEKSTQKPLKITNNPEEKEFKEKKEEIIQRKNVHNVQSVAARNSINDNLVDDSKENMDEDSNEDDEEDIHNDNGKESQDSSDKGGSKLLMPVPTIILIMNSIIILTRS